MKKNAIKHMNPPKRGFGSFFKKLHIIPFLLCVILAVLFWLVTANLNQPKTTDTENTTEETETETGTETEETTGESSSASVVPLFYEL